MERTHQFATALLLAAIVAAPGSRVLAHGDNRAGFQVRTHDLSSQIGGNEIHAIARTGNGYLWVGTPIDLYRFNGNRFTSVTELFDIRRPRVNALHADGGVLYIGTAGRGVYRLSERGVDHFSRDDGLLNDVVWGFANSPDGALYIGTSDGVSRLRGDSIETVSGFEGHSTGIAIDANGNLWARYGDGSLRLSNSGGARVVSVDATRVLALYPRADGEMWIGTDAGLFVAPSADRPFQPVASLAGRSIGRIVGSSSEEVWLSTQRGEIYHWINGSWHHRHVSARLPDPWILSLAADTDSGLWVGTRGGLAQVLGGAVVSLGPAFTGTEVWAVVRDNGFVWTASDGAGLRRIDPDKLTVNEPVPGLPTQSLWALAPSPGGGLWVGSGDAGAFLIRDNTLVRHITDLPTLQVWSVYEDTDGTMLVGTDGGGLLRWHDGERRVFDKASGLAGDRIWAIHPFGRQRYWIGTNNGLCRLELDELRCYDRADALPGNAVWSVSSAADGRYWVSTDEGLAIAAANGAITPVLREPLSSANVFATHQTVSGDLWVLSAQGLHHVRSDEIEMLTRPSSEYSPVGRLFGRADGLTQTLTSGASPAMAVDDFGGLWLATSGGPALVQIDSVDESQTDARLVIEGLIVDGVRQGLSSELVFPAGTRQVRVEIATLSFRHPEHTLIQHRLTGADATWSEPSLDREVVLSHLPAREHGLEIRLAPNAYGLVAEPLRLGFEILPFWHQRTSVHLALIALLGLMLAGLYRWRVRTAVSVHRKQAVTAQRELIVARRVAETERRFRDIFSGVTDLVLLTDATGRIVEANPAATRLIPGCQAGARLEDVLPGGGDGEPSRQVEFDDDSGHRRTLDLRATRHGAAQLIVGRDITEARATQARSAAAERLEAIGKLTAGVAHDFNNLLTVIMCNAEMLEDELGEERHRGMIRLVLDAASHAADITGKLLSIGRRQTIRPRRIELNRHLSDMGGLLTRVIEENIAINFSLHGTPVVSIDPGLLEQIVLNLVINARDAIRGHGKIEIETRPVDLDLDFIVQHPGLRPGPHVCLTVRDTGHGMDEKTMARAFEPFFTTKRSGEGTGLGLATVYGAVKQSQGSVFISSAANAGTTVDIYLPTSRLPAEAKPEPAAPRAVRRVHRVLVAEDNQQILRLIDTALSANNFDVTTASGMEEALEAWRDGDFSLLISDVVMTDGTGPELVRRLEAEGKRPPVLFISGYAHDHIEGLGDSDTQIMTKPFRVEELVKRALTILQS